MVGMRGIFIGIGFALAATGAQAHFQQIIPSADVAEPGQTVGIELVFTHPMERGPVMEMKKPRRFGALVDGKFQDLSGTLKSARRQDKTIWTSSWKPAQPGVGIFYVEPEPYWEPAEGKYIVHHAKVVVDAGATGKDWDAMVGAPVEIEPLVRPTGLWAGNLFQGIVRKNGKPVPFAEVEVEFMNDGSVKPPNDAFVTQVIKADGNGVFTYAMPRAGWWGFAALIEGDEKMKSPSGEDAPVELGALIWVKATAMPAAPARR
ncbi:MAG: DUF4198 domain-containing protein [Beijerinckiaceae bacterium]